MPKTYYCWRCKMPIPMLTEDEWQEVEPILSHDIQRIKEYREKHLVGLREAIEALHFEACDKYFEITGFRETNHAAIWHHRLLRYGPECENCGHLLRTSEASFCANCGVVSSSPNPAIGDKNQDSSSQGK